MAEERLHVELPALGESVVEGTVSAWLVKEGDPVERDQPLVEVTTDKVDAEIPSPVTGRVEEILVSEGEAVPVGTPLVRLRVEPPPGARRGEAPAPRSEALPGGAARPAPPPTPLARRLAAASEVDLSQLEGSGPAGRVVRADLERPVSARAASDARPLPSPTERPAAVAVEPLASGDRVIPMSPLRRAVAEHMVRSKRESPHVGAVAEVDLAGVARLRERHGPAFRDAHGFGLSYLPFVVHATVRALREFPALNASVVDDTIVEKRDVHLGVAVDADKGLVVPVVRHADRLSLTGLAHAIEDLATRARSRRISPDELRGGTFTVSNPGRRGNLYGFAIIHQPQVGILRMGEVAKRAVVRTVGGEDLIVVRPIMYLALSYDHRAVDGAPANAFLYRIRELLEEARFEL